MALCPISILISGFHGNTDPIMVFFILLSVYLLESRALAWAAGLAFGMAINIKIVPLILVPTVFFYLRNWRARCVFFTCAALIIVLCWMPYIAQDPVGILRATLGYRSFEAPWGLSYLIYLVKLADSPTPFLILRWTIITSATVTPIWMNKRGANLYTQIGVVIFLFFFLTPGFGVQYLAWLVPFVLTLGIGWTLSYYFSAGAFLFLLYNYWSGGNWYFAESHIEPPWNAVSVAAGLVCCLIGSLALVRFRDEIIHPRTPTALAPTGAVILD